LKALSKTAAYDETKLFGCCHWFNVTVDVLRGVGPSMFTVPNTTGVMTATNPGIGGGGGGLGAIFLYLVTTGVGLVRGAGSAAFSSRGGEVGAEMGFVTEVLSGVGCCCGVSLLILNLAGGLSNSCFSLWIVRSNCSLLRGSGMSWSGFSLFGEVFSLSNVTVPNEVPTFQLLSTLFNVTFGTSGEVVSLSFCVAVSCKSMMREVSNVSSLKLVNASLIVWSNSVFPSMTFLNCSIVQQTLTSHQVSFRGRFLTA
jgi:hypothetical protein